MNISNQVFKPRRTTLSLLVSTVLCPLALAGNPELKPDDAYITVDVTVKATAVSSFILDYGEGEILVEMDDWDRYKEGAGILRGDKVTARGFIDHDLYETKKIEAGSVYVKGLNTYFYANPMDEEDLSLTIIDPVENGSTLEVSGNVTDVNGREFTLDLGTTNIKVDTRALGYDPLDDKGLQQLDEGDRVWVKGRMDYDFFEKEEIVADMVVSIIEDEGKSKSKR
ncbi:hypothetical protein [Pleionea sediminis]|uniref:hypothetical protein n=1 Tax=Pleionea sediminis TaxID=2569479 RepID=UPI001184D41E|nr:hypothetical protein [Pleionea sediminis]